jgi:3-phenylpropionate/cinnamic acid dioxygenase small subunit
MFVSPRLTPEAMSVSNSILTPELRLDVQEFYFRYAECLDGGRLQQWPEFFLESGAYRITTRRTQRLGPDDDIVYLSSRASMQDRIVAIGQSEDYEPHTQRHLISNFRMQAASGEELRVQANFHVLRTFPGRVSEYFASGQYSDRVTISSGRLSFKEKICVLDSDVPPESLVYPL